MVTLQAAYYRGPGKTFRRFCFEGGIMEFISNPLKPGQVPDPWTVVEEINMVFFTHLQAMYYLLSDETIDAAAWLNK